MGCCRGSEELGIYLTNTHGFVAINFIMTEGDTSVIDKVVTVCSALCNCCESVVPFE